MAIDLFDFWAAVGPSDHVHPADRDVLDRVVDHGFNLNCLPACFLGPLRTAPIVLMFLSLGLADEDIAEAATQRGQKRYMELRAGLQPLPGPEEHKVAWRWWASRTRCFGGKWQRLRTKIATLEICAYHSQKFSDFPLLAALPSSRASLEWAQTILFPQAIAGDRTVVCLRASRFWGLTEGQQYGRSLFAPLVTRGGHMCHNEMRNQIIRDVQMRLEL
jgi:hypothetical protein